MRKITLRNDIRLLHFSVKMSWKCTHIAYSEVPIHVAKQHRSSQQGVVGTYTLARASWEAINVRATLHKNVNVKDDGDVEFPSRGNFDIKIQHRRAAGWEDGGWPLRHCNPIKWIRNEVSRSSSPRASRHCLCPQMNSTIGNKKMFCCIRAFTDRPFCSCNTPLGYMGFFVGNVFGIFNEFDLDVKASL